MIFTYLYLFLKQRSYLPFFFLTFFYFAETSCQHKHIQIISFKLQNNILKEETCQMKYELHWNLYFFGFTVSLY